MADKQLPSIEEMDSRLGQEMLRCARDYNLARADLAQHHEDMGQEEKSLIKQLADLAPTVDALLDGTGPGMTPEVAQKCIQYLEKNAKLRQVRQGRRLAYAATLPPGDAPLGGALGDPE